MAPAQLAAPQSSASTRSASFAATRSASRSSWASVSSTVALTLDPPMPARAPLARTPTRKASRQGASVARPESRSRKPPSRRANRASSRRVASCGEEPASSTRSRSALIVSSAIACQARLRRGASYSYSATASEPARARRRDGLAGSSLLAPHDLKPGSRRVTHAAHPMPTVGKPPLPADVLRVRAVSRKRPWRLRRLTLAVRPNVDRVELADDRGGQLVGSQPSGRSSASRTAEGFCQRPLRPWTRAPA